MVVSLKRRATPQRARKGASRLGFDAPAPDFRLHALRMRDGHSTRRASRIRASASETRLMGIVETGSGDAARLLAAGDITGTVLYSRNENCGT